MAGVQSAFDAVGIAIQVVAAPPVFDVIFTDQPITSYPRHTGKRQNDGDAVQQAVAGSRHLSAGQQILCFDHAFGRGCGKDN